MTEKLSSELEALKQENQLLKQKVEQLRDELKQKVWSKDKNKQWWQSNPLLYWPPVIYSLFMAFQASLVA